MWHRRNSSWTILIAAAIVVLVATHPSVTALQENGEESREDKTPRGMLGARLTYEEVPGPPARGRFLVQDVVAGSPAEQAGLQASDVVVAVNGNEFRFADDLQLVRAWEWVRAGDRVELSVEREEAKLELELVATEMPENARRGFEEMLQSARQQHGLRWLGQLGSGESFLLTIERLESGALDIRADGISEDVVQGLEMLLQRTGFRVVAEGLRPKDSMKVRLSRGEDGNPRFDHVEVPPYLEDVSDPR